MYGSLVIDILIIFALTLANSFFAAAEIAIVSARHNRLQQQIDKGKRGAKEALELAENPDRFLATVQVGITLISNIAAAFGGAQISEAVSKMLVNVPYIAPFASTLSFIIVVLLITYVSLVIGELTPKRLALQFAESIAIATAPTMTTISVVARPIVALLSGSVNLVLRLLRQKPSKETNVTEEDIVYLTHEGIASGSVEAGEEEFIQRIFQFTDRIVRTIMTPRTEIVAVSAESTISEAVDTFMESAYSRLPVYQNDLDNIVGFLYAKDLLTSLKTQEPAEISKLMHQPFFITEYQHADDLLTIFRREGTHMAMVVDEYGQVIGLITLEDVLEELVGEIQDEYDEKEESSIVKREDGSWLVDAIESYERVCEKIPDLPPMPTAELGEYLTLAGLILARLGRIPDEGDTLELGNYTVEIVDMDNRRIDKVLIKPGTKAE
ncbi:MAG TPA: hemolysin family protein [Ktedonobacteraceae bacterium]|nr:hemolysin family protein [Ktedonobacteraceae bacterium]